MREIKKIMDYDLNSFISYLSDAKGLPLSELITTNFSALISSIDPSTKGNAKVPIYLNDSENVKLDASLAGYEAAISKKIEEYPYFKNVFIMMKYLILLKESINKVKFPNV